MEQIYTILNRIEEKLNKTLDNSLEGAPAQKPVEKKIDGLGRVTLPISIRRNLDLEEGSKVNVYTLGNKIIIEKSE